MRKMMNWTGHLSSFNCTVFFKRERDGIAYGAKKEVDQLEAKLKSANDKVV